MLEIYEGNIIYAVLNPNGDVNEVVEQYNRWVSAVAGLLEGPQKEIYDNYINQYNLLYPSI